MRTKAKLPPYNEAAEKGWSRWLDVFVGLLEVAAVGVKSSDFYWNSHLSEPRCEKHRGRSWCLDSSSEEDGQRYCEKCGVILDHGFTDYGAVDEIEASADDDMRDQPVLGEEAFTLLNVIRCGWPRLTERTPDFDLHSDLRPALIRICLRLSL